ncbi:MAG: IS630 family transposase [Opitutaceae bacterium]|nr:IS630 family transposase [Opitutaceae bacterium]
MAGEQRARCKGQDAPLIVFEDEGRFRRISDLRSCRAPFPQRPLVPRRVVRQSLYVFEAVAPLEGKLFWSIEGKGNTDAMGRFLLTLLEANPGRRMVLFVDGAGWHRAKRLPVPQRLRLELLPPCTPECNPVEQLWEELREKWTGNRLFETLDAVGQTLKNALGNLEWNDGNLRRLMCFGWIKEAWLLYI